MAKRLPASLSIRRKVPLKSLTTLRAGGSAELFTTASNVDDLATAAVFAQASGMRTTYLGSGSNMLPSDEGVPGLVLMILAKRIFVRADGFVEADCGCQFQELFLKTAQARLAGLSFAVGIPGTLGGALVSNAGAYRANIADFLTEIEIAQDGERCWVSPSHLGFAYRDSILRRPEPPNLCLLRVRLQLARGNPRDIYDSAREYQRQRIAKQPPQASAGSFFKNVADAKLAESLGDLPKPLREKGIVPSGHLIEAVGLKGHRLGGAVLGPLHANFIVNLAGATATNIRDLASLAKRAVFERFGVELEEEVLYLGDWSAYGREPKGLPG